MNNSPPSVYGGSYSFKLVNSVSIKGKSWDFKFKIPLFTSCTSVELVLIIFHFILPTIYKLKSNLLMTFLQLS